LRDVVIIPPFIVRRRRLVADGAFLFGRGTGWWSRS